MPLSDQILHLNDANAWDLVWDNSFQAQSLGGSRYSPIAPYTLPFSFESHVLAIRCSSSTAPERWYRGLIACQLLSATIGRFGEGKLIADAKTIPLNEQTLIQFPQTTDEFFLGLKFFPWYLSIYAAVYTFSGIIERPVREGVQTLLERTETTTFTIISP